MKKKIKKIQIKNNPEIRKDLITQLIFSLHKTELHLSEEHFTSAVQILKQGFLCDDCNRHYLDCECEWCDDCNYPRCICDLKVKIKNIKEFKKYIIKFAKKNLTEIEYFTLVKKLKSFGKKMIDDYDDWKNYL